MLHLHHSNRLEHLSDLFAGLTQADPLPPFAAEKVVVQNAGMGRWLSLQLARQQGIAANLAFLFPAEIVWELMRAVLGEAVPRRDPCSPKLLRWRLLQAFLTHPERWRGSLGHYLGEGQEGNAWQLAQQLARVYDSYLFFRPDWIQRWEQEGVTTDWQAQLWQQVVGGQRLLHSVNLHQRFMRALEEGHADGLPERICFFSVPALSPAYIALVNQVAQYRDVHFFIMNPSDEYWGDIESEKRRIRFAPEAQPYVTVGNPLLASWGRQGRDFIENLRNAEPYPQESERFVDPGHDTVLHCIQQDILNLAGERQSLLLPAVPAPLPPGERRGGGGADSSLHIHACHSPMREVEVLHDQLLAVLEADASLTPADIVVMSPEIETYAPLIETVFGGGAPELPFSIADQRYPGDRNLVAATRQLLALPQGRFEAESVFALLDYPEIRTRFRLDEEQVQQCREWVRAVQVRWGVDAEFRRQFARQTTFEHTWLYGLDRLLLGYTLPGEALFGEVLPFDALEGSQVLVLERFLQCVHTLFALARWRQRSLTLTQWGERLLRRLHQLFGEDAELAGVSRALESLLEGAQEALFTRKIGFGVFRDALLGQLEQGNQADGFLGYGITFCTLMPMRSVPFRLVALLGMQDGGFPRQETRLSFDRLVRDPYRKGDRSRRDEDRYLFLESLLSARDRFYISYVGQSVQDDSRIMPSVLVGELLDYLEQRFGLQERQVVTRHPLQAFSPRYYSNTDPQLFSYAPPLWQAAAQRQPQPFWNVTAPLPAPEAGWRYPSLTELIGFFRKPAATFLRQRLGLDLYEPDDELPGREPFMLEVFVDSELGRQGLEWFRQGGEADGFLALLRAQGLLPHGRPGELVFERELAVVARVMAQLADTDTGWQSRRFQLEWQDAGLHGVLDHLTPQGRWQVWFGHVGVWQWLEVWITHLALNACHELPEGQARCTFILTPDESWVLAPVADAEAQLKGLFERYWQGLQYPLPFFPKSAWAMLDKGGKASAAPITPLLKDAEQAWYGNDFHAGEGSKAEYALLYRGQQECPLQLHAHEFMALAQQVLGALLEARRSG